VGISSCYQIALRKKGTSLDNGGRGKKGPDRKGNRLRVKNRAKVDMGIIEGRDTVNKNRTQPAKNVVP